MLKPFNEYKIKLLPWIKDYFETDKEATFSDRLNFKLLLNKIKNKLKN